MRGDEERGNVSKGDYEALNDEVQRLGTRIIDNPSGVASILSKASIQTAMSGFRDFSADMLENILTALEDNKTNLSIGEEEEREFNDFVYEGKEGVTSNPQLAFGDTAGEEATTAFVNYFKKNTNVKTLARRREDAYATRKDAEQKLKILAWLEEKFYSKVVILEVLRAVIPFFNLLLKEAKKKEEESAHREQPRISFGNSQQPSYDFDDDDNAEAQ